MNMREAIARGKIHLFSEFEDAIKQNQSKEKIVDAWKKQDLHKSRLPLTYARVDTQSEMCTFIDQWIQTSTKQSFGVNFDLFVLTFLKTNLNLIFDSDHTEIDTTRICISHEIIEEEEKEGIDDES